MVGRKLYSHDFRYEIDTVFLLFERKSNNNNHEDKKNQSSETDGLMRLCLKIPTGTVTAQE